MCVGPGPGGRSRVAGRTGHFVMAELRGTRVTLPWRGCGVCQRKASLSRPRWVAHGHLGCITPLPPPPPAAPPPSSWRGGSRSPVARLWQLRARRGRQRGACRYVGAERQYQPGKEDWSWAWKEQQHTTARGRCRGELSWPFPGRGTENPAGDSFHHVRGGETTRLAAWLRAPCLIESEGTSRGAPPFPLLSGSTPPFPPLATFPEALPAPRPQCRTHPVPQAAAHHGPQQRLPYSSACGRGR